MRLREFLELQGKDNKSLQEWKSTGSIYNGNSEEEGEEWIDQHLDTAIERFAKHYGKDGFFKGYYSGMGPENHALPLEGDVAGKAGDVWINLYENQIKIKDVFNQDFYDFIKKNRNGTPKTVVRIDDFVYCLIDIYFEDKVVTDDNSGIYFKTKNGSIYFYCQVKLRSWHDTKGIIVINANDDPKLFVYNDAVLENLVIDQVEEKIKYVGAPVEDIVDTIIYLYSGH